MLRDPVVQATFCACPVRGIGRNHNVSRNASAMLSFCSALNCLPLAELEGKVSPLVTDEVLF